MEFTIKCSKILNTSLTSTDDSILYNIHTEQKVTTIHRKDAGKSDVLVAQVEWHTFHPTLITMGSMTIEKGGYLKGSAWLP
jgi:hypothetical protein